MMDQAAKNSHPISNRYESLISMGEMPSSFTEAGGHASRADHRPLETFATAGLETEAALHAREPECGRHGWLPSLSFWSAVPGSTIGTVRCEGGSSAP